MDDFVARTILKNNKQNMVYIYVLKLNQGKYYIGKTERPDVRFIQHFSNTGSIWTKTYQPLLIHEIIPNCDTYDEDKYTLKYMKEFGIENVRGGSFTQIELPEESLSVIHKMLLSSSDLCFKCGKEGHFAKDCNPNKNKVNQELELLKQWCKEHTEDHNGFTIYDYTNEKIYSIPKHTFFVNEVKLENLKGPQVTKIAKEHNITTRELFEYNTLNRDKTTYILFKNENFSLIVNTDTKLKKKLRENIENNISNTLTTGEIDYIEF
jgi:hypothetical protein